MRRANGLAARSSRRLRKVGYSNAGTVEFLRDASGELYFIEMNARIQVEHPVTEMVTQVDLVKAQIRVAAGERLEDAVGAFDFRGHAIECRINAEDPETFVPSPGRITAFRVPGGPGIRVDTAAYADAVIPPYYDSLVAKLIAHGRDRAEAIARMHGALDGFVVEGIKTTIPLHKRILAEPDFIAGKFDTHFLERLAAGGSEVAGGAPLFPALYAILDPGLVAGPLGPLAETLADAGVQLMQLRDKPATAARLFAEARELAALLSPRGVRFIVNDRPDIAAICRRRWRPRRAGRLARRASPKDLRAFAMGGCFDTQPGAIARGRPSLRRTILLWGLSSLQARKRIPTLSWGSTSCGRRAN